LHESASGKIILKDKAFDFRIDYISEIDDAELIAKQG
jgi:hypothetical protein